MFDGSGVELPVSLLQVTPFRGQVPQKNSDAMTVNELYITFVLITEHPDERVYPASGSSWVAD